MVGDITSGLIGHWSLNSTVGTTAFDVAGNDNSGTLVNAPAWTTAGRIHGGLNFSGTNQAVSVPHSSSHLKSPEGGAVPDEQIDILVDEAATRENILKSMRNLFLKADEWCSLTFH